MISKVVEKLGDLDYRRAFIASQINVGIPFQIRALLRARGKTQDWLAKQTGMLQPRISGLMSPGKTRPNIETLRRIAEAFDCGLAIRFVPFTELVEWSERFDPDTFQIPTFEDDIAAMDRRQSLTDIAVGSAAGHGLLDRFSKSGLQDSMAMPRFEPGSVRSLPPMEDLTTAATGACKDPRWANVIEIDAGSRPTHRTGFNRERRSHRPVVAVGKSRRRHA